jgi:hypothetical protein
MLHKGLARGWRGPLSRRRSGGEQVVPDGGLGATCFGSVPEPERTALGAFLVAHRPGIRGPLGESSDCDGAE